MNIFPAIDLYDGKAVRLYKGDYQNMTVYSENPVEIVEDFKRQGAKFLHLVDLEGAKTGGTPNLKTVEKLVSATDSFVEVGGGIRSEEVIKRYVDAGVKRVILGTAAVNDRKFLERAVSKFQDKIAVGVDIKDGFVAIKGWTEKSNYTALQFVKELSLLGVSTIISTDVSKDGAMQGANHSLYKTLMENTDIQIIASGGVSSIEDVKILANMGLYGAIMGKAYYIKAISIEEAIKVAR